MGKQLPVIQRKQLYSDYYLIADTILKKYNPCNISADGKTCIGGTPCCTGCDHLSSKGCTVKALGCKLWLCYTAQIKNPECDKELHELARKAYGDNIPLGYRTSKKESFEPDVEKIRIYLATINRS